MSIGSVLEKIEITLPMLVVVGAIVLIQVYLGVAFFLNRRKHRHEESETALLVEISSKFVHLPSCEVDCAITEAQRRLCELLDIDFMVLWQWSDKNTGSFIATHSYSLQDGVQPTFERSDDAYPWVRSEALAGRSILLRSLDEIPEEGAKDRESASQAGIKSNLTLPLSVGGEKSLGVLTLNTTRRERAWPDPLVKRMQLLAQIFANALARKRSDEQKKESNMRLNLAMDSADAGLWELDLDSQTFFLNEKSQTIFGYTPNELATMRKFEASVHPEDWPTVEKSISGAVKSGLPINVEYRIRHADGEEHWVISKGRPCLTSEGKVERILGLSMDITHRKRAESQLHQMSLVVDQSPVLVVITDVSGIIVYANQKFTEVTGYSLDECIGKTPRILKSGDYATKAYKELWASILQGEVWSGEFHNRKKNGELYWERAIISPMINAKGKVTHFIGIKEDITEQRRTEIETQELRTNLAHSGRVTLLGQLASALAHELSQPLGAILRNAEAAEIMLKSEAPDLIELRAIIDDILRDDERAGQVIARLRSLLKRRSIDTQAVSMPEVITEVLTLVQADAVDRSTTITTSISADLPNVLADRIHLQQVLLNLIVNAMDAMNQCSLDHRRVEISVCLPNLECVEVRICDAGVGIPADSLEKLFEPFFTSKPNGMGVGLPVSRTIIEAHQGKLWAENRPEGGACFCFTLPVAVDDSSLS